MKTCTFHFISVCFLLMSMSIGACGQSRTPTINSTWFPQEGIPLRAPFKVILKVTDDRGLAISGADAGFSWGWLGYKKPDTDFRRLNTDSAGKSIFTGETIFNQYAYGATKEGYYAVRGVKGKFMEQREKRWEPWGQELNVILRPQKNPVAMFVKSIDTALPTPGKWAGYDFEIGDWVFPHGKGKHADVEFLVTGEQKDYSNYNTKMTMRFLGEGNGILPYKSTVLEESSEFKFPYLAPEEGYINEISWRSIRHPDENSISDVVIEDAKNDTHYIFRIRSSVDENGKAVKSMYGKILNPLNVISLGEGNGRIRFVHYLNPDMTRNLEYDPKKNLIKERFPRPYPP